MSAPNKKEIEPLFVLDVNVIGDNAGNFVNYNIN